MHDVTVWRGATSYTVIGYHILENEKPMLEEWRTRISKEIIYISLEVVQKATSSLVSRVNKRTACEGHLKHTVFKI